MSPSLPQSDRSDADTQGHWLLARLGKKVLRPGGAELTARLLSAADVRGRDVVEFAPGLGRTARDIIALQPRTYTGVDADPDAIAAAVKAAPTATLVQADAAATGLPDASADLVLGEAMLTLQGEKAKHAIVAEAARVLRTGGRYAIHELALVPDDLDDETKTEIRRALARSIKVNARPQTRPEWRALLEARGFSVVHVDTAPMALLQPRRIVADEGVMGALRFAFNVLTHPDARRRVLDMRRTFTTHRERLMAIAIVAVKDDPNP